MSADTAKCPPDCLVSFPHGDFPYLAAAAIVARTGIAWFEINATGVRLAAMGNELGLARQLGASVSNRVSNPPISGFGVVAAELPSVVQKAITERWASLDINVTPQDDTATVVQDRKVLTGGTPPAMNLLAGLLDLGDDKLDRADLTICWQRPAALDSLSTGDGETGINIGALRECLDAAEKLITIDADQPDYELLELANGLAHGGSLNLRFCLEAPSLRGVDLRLSRSQVRTLAKLLAAF